MNNKDNILSSFVNVTGATLEEAQFYLDANGWNIDTAVATYLSTKDEAGQQPVREPVRPKPLSQPPQPQPTQKPTSSKSSKPSSGRVATLGSLGSKDDSDSDDDTQKYYAGGEKSGQMIHYPKDAAERNQNTVKELFESAKQKGAKTAEEANKPAPPTYFQGSGHTLGDTTHQSHIVAAPQKPKGPEKISRTITFWKNGFSIDDGPLRSMEDPQGREFIADINKGHVPREMAAGVANRDTEWNINLVDKSAQDYQEPAKPKAPSFSGSGHTLGSAPSSAPTTTTPVAPPTVNKSFSVDESKPTTSIQMRLADGTRLVSKFNHTHTVGDIRNFIALAARGHPNFDLMTPFPQKILTDNSQTIADAGLVNAVVVQKLK